MIADKLKNWRCYASLSPRFEKAFRYLAELDLMALAPGRYDIDGDQVYMLVQEMDLKPWVQGSWEAHRSYADIQLVVQGRELLGVRSADGMPVTEEYDPAKDVMFFQPNAPGLPLPLADGEFAILFPQDAHRPCICREESAPCMHSRRIVVKVRL